VRVGGGYVYESVFKGALCVWGGDNMYKSVVEGALCGGGGAYMGQC